MKSKRVTPAKRAHISFLGWCLSCLVASMTATAQSVVDGKVDRLDPALDALIEPGTIAELLKGDYFGYLEGPTWVRNGGYLLFSDVPANRIYKWSKGQLFTFLDKSGFTGTDSSKAGVELSNGRLQVVGLGSNGITLDPQGRVVFCAHGDRAVKRLEEGGQVTPLVDKFEGKRFSGPNDLVYRSDGTLYFSDRESGLRGGASSPYREIPYNGLFMLKDGKVRLVDKDPPGPNGLALSPDERYLYVGFGPNIMRYQVQRDGTLTNRTVHFTLQGSGARASTDGMRVDRDGNLYIAGSGGVWVVTRDAHHLGTIGFSAVTNVAFGDQDGKSLYIMARRDLYRIRLKVAGALFGSSSR